MNEQATSGASEIDPRRWAFGFNGQYRHALDDKGRVSVPALFRKDAAGNAIARFKLTVGFEGCLFLFPHEYWRAVVEPQLLDLPIMERDARVITRRFFSLAADCDPDKQGRIMIPAPLRERAALEGDVIVNGMYNRVELWSVDRWLAFESEADGRFEEAAEKYRIRF